MTQKAGYEDFKVTMEDLRKIEDKFEADDMDIDNIMSDFKDLRKDNTLFTGPHGKLADDHLNEAKDLYDKDEKDANVRAALSDALYELIQKMGGNVEGLRVPGGKRRRRKTRSTRPLGRRGRKSRRKSLRQRK